MLPNDPKTNAGILRITNKSFMDFDFDEDP